MKMGPIGCPETFVRSCIITQKSTVLIRQFVSQHHPFKLPPCLSRHAAYITVGHLVTFVKSNRRQERKRTLHLKTHLRSCGKCAALHTGKLQSTEGFYHIIYIYIYMVFQKQNFVHNTWLR
jgi:hypothetical protein